MICFGEVPSGAVLPIYFDSFAGATGAPITITGLATTDIEVVKGTSVTVRASDSGYALLDTDGIDIGGRTGIHGFTIDTGDNADSGFYAVGSFCTVLVDAVTIDSQTVRFIAATFRIKAAEAITGKAKVDVDGWLGTAAATPTVAGVPEVDVTHWIGTAAATPTTAGVPEVDLTFIAGAAVSATTAQLGVNVVNINNNLSSAQKLQQYFTAIAAGTSDSGTTTTMVDAVRTEADTDYFKDMVILFTSGTLNGQSRRITAFDPATDTITFAPATTAAVSTQTYMIFQSGTADVAAWNGTAVATPTVAGVPSVEVIDISAAGQTDTRTAVGLATANLDTQLSALPTAAENADAVWDEDATGHQTTGTFGAAIGDPGVETTTIWDQTFMYLDATISSRASQTSLDTVDDFLDTEIAAIKAKTDSLTFTVAGVIDANVTHQEGGTDVAAAIRSAVGLASADLDTQLAALPTAAENATELFDQAAGVETGLTLREWCRIVGAATGGKLSGAGTGTETIRNAVADSKDRLVATVDASGNRTAITYDLT